MKTIDHTKETITQTLKTDVAHVSFEKVNGDIKEMFVTLRGDVLPPPKPVDETVDKNDTMKKKRKVNENQVNVWSVEDSAWRSFRLDKLKTFNVIPETEAQTLLESVAQKNANA